jgi:hypothetical protein
MLLMCIYLEVEPRGLHWEDVKYPPHELIGMSDPGGGNPPAKFLPQPGIFSDPPENKKTLFLHS